MQMNKKTTLKIILPLSLILLIALSAGCLEEYKNNNKRINIVATFYPLAYFAEEIGGVYVDVHQLTPDNTDLHNWQPTTADIIKVNKADIIIINGAGLDEWFKEDVLPSIDTSDKLIVETTNGVKLLEIDHDEDNHEEEHNEHHHEHGLYDPHTWIDPYVAMHQAENIYKALVYRNPEYADYYTERWVNLKDRFISVNEAYNATLKVKKKDEVIVTHAAFGYLAHRYNFKQYSIIGLTADEQPSVDTIRRLVDKMIEDNITTIYVDYTYTSEYAQSLKNTIESKTGFNIQILKLYLMIGFLDDLDYFDQLLKNLDNLSVGLQTDEE